MNTVNFTRKSYLALRKAYAKAVADKAETFVLEVGDEKHEVLTSYAKHLLAYLAPHFGRAHDNF